MNKNKLIKFNVGFVTALLFLVGGISPTVAAKKRSYNNVHYSYSSKTHKITFRGSATGFRNLTVKYNGKAVKNVKIKKNSRSFKVAVPFKGYKTFKLYGGNQLIGTITAAKYASKKPHVYDFDQNNGYLRVGLDAKKGDIVKIWKNGKQIARYRITTGNTTYLKVPNTEFENKAKVTVTRHTLGKKTSKGVKLDKLPDNNTGVIIG